MKSQNCETCRFLRNFECHRFPPKYHTGNDINFVDFPKVEANWWCGEWKLCRPIDRSQKNT